eukprot:6469719-Amphidinium_carterae.1
MPGWPAIHLRANDNGISLGSVSSQRTVRPRGGLCRPLAFGKWWNSARSEKSLSPFGPWLKTHAQEEPGMEWLKKSSQENQLDRNMQFRDPSSSNLSVDVTFALAAELNTDFLSTFAPATQNRTWMLCALSACRRADCFRE